MAIKLQDIKDAKTRAKVASAIAQADLLLRELKHLGAGGGFVAANSSDPMTVSAGHDSRSGSARPKSSYNRKIVLDYWATFGIPVAVTEYRFHPKRKWRFDFAWPTVRVALEVEGGVWTGGRHTRGAGFLRDMEKYNSAAIAGWRVLRCVPSELCTKATALLLRFAIIHQADQDQPKEVLP